MVAHIKLSGDWITFSGVKFQNGTRKDNSDLVKNKGNYIADPVEPLISVTGSYNRITFCSINNFDGTHGIWGELNGFSNRIDHCSFTNKMTHGNFWNVGTQKEGVYHRIDHNFFSRPKIKSNSASALRLGSGHVADHSAKIMVEHNTFETCDGEGEVISDKCSDNIHRYNKYLNCNGVLSLRQSNRTHVYGNLFIRDAAFEKIPLSKPRPFGIGVHAGGHLIENNYFQGFGTAMHFAAGQPVGYVKPGRSPNLVRHHIAAYDMIIRKNTFLVNGSAFKIESKMPEKDNRIAQPQNIRIYSNLFIAVEGNEITKGNTSGFNIAGNSINISFKNSAQENIWNDFSLNSKSQVVLPNSLLQRYGSLVGSQAE